VVWGACVTRGGGEAGNAGEGGGAGELEVVEDAGGGGGRGGFERHVFGSKSSPCLPSLFTCRSRRVGHLNRRGSGVGLGDYSEAGGENSEGGGGGGLGARGGGGDTWETVGDGEVAGRVRGGWGGDQGVRRMVVIG